MLVINLQKSGLIIFEKSFPFTIWDVHTTSETEIFKYGDVKVEFLKKKNNENTWSHSTCATRFSTMENHKWCIFWTKAISGPLFTLVKFINTSLGIMKVWMATFNEKTRIRNLGTISLDHMVGILPLFHIFHMFPCKQLSWIDLIWNPHHKHLSSS